MEKIFNVLFLIVFLSSSAFSQATDTTKRKPEGIWKQLQSGYAAPKDDDLWKTLMSVSYRPWRHAFIPSFGANIKAYEGKKVKLKGYMYPLEESDQQSFFILSYYPVNACFFCGGAGPESVVEVNAKKPIRFQRRMIQLEGTLRLNADDPDRMFFILEDAVIK